MTQQRYRDLAEWPLMGTAIVFLAAYAWQVIGRMEGRGAEWLEATMWTTWGIFVLDMYPVTPLGRFVAAALMMSGIAVLGVVTAAIASWLVRRVEETTAAAAESAEQPVLTEVGELAAEVAALRREIAELRRDPAP